MLHNTRQELLKSSKVSFENISKPVQQCFKGIIQGCFNGVTIVLHRHFQLVYSVQFMGTLSSFKVIDCVMA